MHSDEFEKAFSEFLDGREYDSAAEGLFTIVRLAFAAGWKAGKEHGKTSSELLEYAETRRQ